MNETAVDMKTSSLP